MSYYVGPYNNLPKTVHRIKNTIYYYKNGLRWWDGKQLRNKAKNKEWYQENKANIKEKNDKPGNKAKAKEKRDKPDNKARAKEYAKEYKQKNKAKAKEYNKEYQQKPENKDKRNKIRRDRRKNDLVYKISNNLRRRHRDGLKSQNVEKTISVLKLMECSVKSLITQLEKQFEPKMTWKNYGRGRGCWNMDHRRCYKSFALKNIEDQRKCCHWTNIQPMWKPENEAKGSKFDEATFEYKWIDKNVGWIKK
jgi:hypothetical protein